MRRPADSGSGEAHATRQVGGLALLEYRYPAGRVVPRHAHELAYFTIVLEGGYEEHGGGRRRTCSGDDLVFYPEGETHTNEFQGQGGHVLRVDLTPSLLGRLRAYGPVLAEPVVLRDVGARLLGTRLHRAFRSADPGSELAIEGLTLELLAMAHRTASTVEKRPPAWLRTVEGHLRACFMEPMGLEALARRVGVHPSHLARSFRAHHRCTIGEFVRRLRVEQACRRLRETGTDLATLAAELGFVDQSHFGRVFKRVTGVTPAEYRRRP